MNKNVLGYGLRHTCEGMAIVVARTTFGDIDETEELPVDEARALMRELRQSIKKTEKTII